MSVCPTQGGLRGRERGRINCAQRSHFFRVGEEVSPPSPLTDPTVQISRSGFLK
jgi:hypothetical protein